VALTAFANKEYLEKCAAVGIETVLSKPARRDKISSIIENVLNIKKLEK